MARVAQAGERSIMTPAGNVASWVFSDPFTTDSEVLLAAPTEAAANHAVPPLPGSRTFLHDLSNGAKLNFDSARNDAQDWANGLLDLLGTERSLRKLGVDNFGQKSRMSTELVLIQLPNCLQFSTVLFGTWKAGLTASLAGTSLTADELAWIIENASPTVVITTTSHRHTLASAFRKLRGGSKLPAHVFFVDVANDTYGQSVGKSHSDLPRDDWKTLLTKGPSKVSSPMLSGADAAVILWSSGTSGRSKGVVISHRALIASLISLWHTDLQYGSEEVWCGFVPFVHVFGLVVLFLLGPCCGATVHILQPFNPFAMMEAVKQYSVTALHMAPPVAAFLAKDPSVKKSDVSSVKSVLSGGAPCPKEIIDAVHAKLGLWVRMGYGLSEATAVTEESVGASRKSQSGYTGKPLSGVEIRIVSTDDPTCTLKVDEEGEVQVRSPSLLTCYLNNEQATREAFQGQWFRTGDVGKLDADGGLTVTDRLKDMIKVKGLQVSPSDLENTLSACPLVKDVAVVGVQDAGEWGELPRAYIVPKSESVAKAVSQGRTRGIEALLGSQAHSIRSWVEERAAKYKWLRGNIVFVDVIPRSPNGKMLKRLLKDSHGYEVPVYSAIRAKI